MDDWDAQKMLDLYIHDYLVRKNMHTTADILAKEADIETKSVAINPPDGFLSEWWSLFWDVYSSRIPNNPQAQAPEDHPNSSKAPVGEGSSAPQNDLPDVSFMLQNASPGIPSMLQAVNPSPMPMSMQMPMAMPIPEMGGFLPNAFPPMMPKMDFSANRFGQAPITISDNYMRKERQDQTMNDLIAQKVREKQNFSLPPRFLDSANSNVLNVDQLANMLPLGSSSSHQKKKVGSKRQLPLTNDVNYGASFRRSVPSELPPHAPKLQQEDMGQAADAGREIFEKLPSEGHFLTESNKQTKYTALSEGCLVDNYSDLAAQASKKLIISASENLTKMINPTLIDDGSKGKGVQIEGNTETEVLLDDDIASFFSNDEASDNMDISSTHTSAQKDSDQPEFPFRPVKSIHPSNNKLLCCDFSTQGKFLAAAGHEKKVFIWNLKQSTRHSVQGHSQLITDIRFKPNSNIFATSSFDKVVKIWDANTKRTLFNLVGHADQVNSVDFHPRKPNLLCSCDCNDEIRLWNIKESTCFRSSKGGNRMVRFQCRQGNLMAAATGNIINLIDVETGMIQHRFEGHEKDVRAISWDVCGEYLVSASQDSARIWSILSGGKCIHELRSSGKDFASCTFHPAYSQVVCVGSYESIYIWNPTMGNKTWKIHGHQGIISSMANAPDTNLIASVSHDQWMKIWK